MLSDFYGWKSLASLDLHGPHLSGGDVVFRAVISPVPAGGPDEHPPVQRHPHRQHLAPSRPHTSGQAAQAPPHQKGKGVFKIASPEPICSAIPQGNPYRLQKKRTISTAGRVCSGSRKPQFTSTWILGRAVPLHTASSFRVLISTAGMPSAYRGNTSSRSVQSSGESGPPLSILVRRLSPTRKKLFDIPPGVGTGRPGTPIDDQELSHARTSSLMAPASSSSRRKRTLQLRNSILWALRAASRRKSACSSSPVSP